MSTPATFCETIFVSVIATVERIRTGRAKVGKGRPLSAFAVRLANRSGAPANSRSARAAFHWTDNVLPPCGSIAASASAIGCGAVARPRAARTKALSAEKVIMPTAPCA